MCARVGGLTAKFYRETHGVKVAGDQKVTAGTILTRQGHRWRPGLNVLGNTSLVAACDGQIYFTHKKNSYRSVITVINVRAEEKSEKPVARPHKESAEKKHVPVPSEAMSHKEKPAVSAEKKKLVRKKQAAKTEE